MGVVDLLRGMWVVDFVCVGPVQPCGICVGLVGPCPCACALMVVVSGYWELGKRGE